MYADLCNARKSSPLWFFFPFLSLVLFFFILHLWECQSFQKVSLTWLRRKFFFCSSISSISPVKSGKNPSKSLMENWMDQSEAFVLYYVEHIPNASVSLYYIMECWSGALEWNGEREKGALISILQRIMWGQDKFTWLKGGEKSGWGTMGYPLLYNLMQNTYTVVRST